MSFGFIPGESPLPPFNEEVVIKSIESSIRKGLIIAYHKQDIEWHLEIASGTTIHLSDEQVQPFMMGLELADFRWTDLVSRVPKDIRELIAIFMV